MSQSFRSTAESRRVEALWKAGHNILVLGSAGTGKSMLIQRLLGGSKKRTQVLAYTGLAALNAGGTTINRFFGIKPEFQRRTDLRLFEEPPEKAENRKRCFQDLDALLIDEVSMLRADLLDAVDAILREHGPRPNEPFGGVQIGLFGDVFQLPPIVEDEVLPAFNGQWSDGWKSPWFFDAQSYLGGGFARITLKRIYRQEAEDHDGREFIRILQRLREGRAQPEDFFLLNKRVVDRCPDGASSLVTLNKRADAFNSRQFDSLAGPAYSYTALFSENWPNGKEGPVPRIVDVKKGARMLVCANNAGQGLVNGSIGEVVGFNDSEVILKVNGIEVPVGKHKWEFGIWRWDGKEMVREEASMVYHQMPLKLAWALTVNKAQGQTIEGPVWIDLEKTWDGGQAYVALSRVRRLDQIYLKKELRPCDIRVDSTALGFHDGGDSPITIPEIRKKAGEIYRETRNLKKQAEAERTRAENERRQAEEILREIQNTKEEIKRFTGRAEETLLEIRNIEKSVREGASEARETEKRIAQTLARARDAGWVKRLLRDF